MKKIIILLLIAGINIFAQTAGNSGLPFLKLGFGARNVAMGDIGVAGINDLTALHYNPSLLAENIKPQFMFTHNSLFIDMNSEMFAGSFKIFDLPIAIGINTTSVDGIEIRTKPGEPDAQFSAQFFSASVSTAHNIYQNINGGITIKYLYESMYTDDASGLALDLGMSYDKLFDGLSLGLAVRNIGSMNSLRNESTELPTDLVLGAAFNFPLEQLKTEFNLTGGFQKYFDNDDSHLHAGAEAVYDDFFSIRFGYISNYESKSISAGFGILWKGLNVDYAYMPVKFGLGDYHIFSFIYSF